jgi:hypothetical protein
MTTKPPSKVEEYPATSLEKIAYHSVSTIPTEEPNDRNRLGYHIWKWLASKEGTLEEAILQSGARMHIPPSEAKSIIAESLQKQGITIK